MQKKKIIIKSIINFFTKNLLSVFGMIMLVLFSSAVFTTLNNATNNLNSSYNRVTSKGNLHDFVINERFTLGDSDYALVGSGTYDPTNQTYSYTITPNTSTWTNSYAKISNDYKSWKATGEIESGFSTSTSSLFQLSKIDFLSTYVVTALRSFESWSTSTGFVVSNPTPNWIFPVLEVKGISENFNLSSNIVWSIRYPTFNFGVTIIFGSATFGW